MATTGGMPPTRLDAPAVIDGGGGVELATLPGSRSRRLLRYWPVLPAIALLAVFLVGPILWSFYGSFTDASLSGPSALSPQWIGFDNYAKLLADPVFPQSLWLTVVFVLFSAIIGQTALGLGIALLLPRVHRAAGAVVTTIIVSAWVLPEIVAAFVSYAFFNKSGTLNQLLTSLGMTGPDWLFSFPMVAIVLANLWRGTAFSMMTYQAALGEVDPEMIEAAKIDGASAWQRLIYISLPTIRTTITTTLMLVTLQTLSIFTLIYVMTAGGPGNQSATLPIFAYKAAFRFGDIGYGTAIATVMLLVGAVFAILYVRALRPGKDAR